MKWMHQILLLTLVLGLSGCSTFSSLVKHSNVHKGMSKQEVAYHWGKPRLVKNAANSHMAAHEEEWLYYNTMVEPKVPEKYVRFNFGKVTHVYHWN